MRIKEMFAATVVLDWSTECGPESADTSYIVTYSYIYLNSGSYLMNSNEKEIFRPPPFRLTVSQDYEYHVTIAVKRGSEIGPQSKTLSLITAKTYPNLTLEAIIKSTEAILIIRPETYFFKAKHTIDKYMIYNIEAVQFEDRRIIKSFYTAENYARFEGLTSNRAYQIRVTVCYRFRGLTTCNELQNHINITTEMDTLCQI